MGHVAHLRGNSHNSNQFSFIMSNLKKIFVIKDSITFKRCSNYRHLFVCLTLWEEDFQRLYFFFIVCKNWHTSNCDPTLPPPPPPSKDNGVIKRTFTQLKLLPHKFQFCKMVLEKKIIFVFLNNYVIYLYRTAPLV